MAKFRYCEMCDVWVSPRQTVCKACGATTSKVVNYCPACDREGKTAGGDITPMKDHACQQQGRDTTHEWWP
jgi:predicted amidophosphoribosyltransferase